MNLNKKLQKPRVRFLETNDVKVETIDNVEIFQASIASELPVFMGEYFEILDIESMDIGRLKDGGNVLFNHDESIYVGVIIDAWKENKKLYAKFRFSNNNFAQEIKRDVQDKVLTKTSLGYYITSMNFEGYQDDVEIYRCGSSATEFSLVTKPADVTTAVGRSLVDKEERELIKNEQNELTNNSEKEMEELVKLINELTAKVDALSTAVESLKPAKTETDTTVTDEARKRELDEQEKVKDQTEIDAAVANIASAISAEVPSTDVSVDEIIARIESEIQDEVNDTIDDLEDDSDEEMV